MVKDEIYINKDVGLIAPNAKRDAKVSVGWLEGEQGRDTLRLMGVLVGPDFVPNVKTEVKRLKKMIKSKDEIIWMITYRGVVVGSLEIWTVQYDMMPTPSFSILVGCPSMRGKCIGTSILSNLHKILVPLGYSVANVRALLASARSNQFFLNNGYSKLGSPYSDENGLVWQNYTISLPVA